jgi:hypothetical protein
MPRTPLPLPAGSIAVDFIGATIGLESLPFAAVHESLLGTNRRLPQAERTTYVERLDKLRSRGRNVGSAVEEEFNSLWYAAALDEHQGQ